MISAGTKCVKSITVKILKNIKFYSPRTKYTVYKFIKHVRKNYVEKFGICKYNTNINEVSFIISFDKIICLISLLNRPGFQCMWSSDQQVS